ncbi:MAG: DNA recombination protein RmuC [Bacteroidetes bacterium]|nr:DNA recombination protein RmuC [Bacteroidota bacterium]
MIEIVLGILALSLGVAGFILGKRMQTTASSAILEERLNQQLLQVEQLNYRNQQLEQINEEQLRRVITLEAELGQAKLAEDKRVQDLEQLQKKFQSEFENLAQKILDEKSSKMNEQNKESIRLLLDPLRERITDFSKKVEDSNKQNLTFHETFKVELRHMQEQSLLMQNEAANLVKALKGDNKMQGNWGEMVLERILEKSGLRKDMEYAVQQSFTTEDGKRLMPDVIINLPDDKKFIIDSKVSLVHYEQLVNTDSDEEKETYAKLHLNSIQRHIKELSEKRYEDLYEVNSPEFVILFIAIEPAFAVALQRDPLLYSKAFDQNIILVTPTTLLATLRTIDSMWNTERQHKHALEIAQKAGALHDKFVGFIEDMNKVGQRMNDAKKTYEEAMNKLHTGRGNVVSSIHKLRELGAKAKKDLPEANLNKALEE